jgi:DNA-binding transcriptional MerR regulator
MSDLTIGQLAKLTGANVATIRYYETEGLMPSVPRTDAGYRLYGSSHVARLRFIVRSRELGFSQPEIRTLLEISEQGDLGCETVDRIAADHLRSIEARIADLQTLATELRRIQSSCGGGSVADCRIIEALTG